MSADEPGMACYECGRKFRRRALQTREVVVHHDDGLGYEEIPVPLCRACIGERYGFDCPQCGLHHDDKESAQYCCRRRPGEAPDCPACGRRMERGSWGDDPDAPEGHQRTVEWAECECCPIGWGRFTGWAELNQDKCEHVDQWRSGFSRGSEVRTDAK